jgi:hypothetical protein
LGCHVVVHVDETNKQKILANWAEINKEFLAVHNQKFKQIVNIGLDKPEGELLEMEHIGIEDRDFFEENSSMVVSCHWDYEHGLQTEQDLKKVFAKFGIIAKTDVSY